MNYCTLCFDKIKYGEETVYTNQFYHVECMLTAIANDHEDRHERKDRKSAEKETIGGIR